LESTKTHYGLLVITGLKYDIRVRSVRTGQGKFPELHATYITRY